jgi:prolipoprotein diacylglyceryltransferase
VEIDITCSSMSGVPSSLPSPIQLIFHVRFVDIPMSLFYSYQQQLWPGMSSFGAAIGVCMTPGVFATTKSQVFVVRPT